LTKASVAAVVLLGKPDCHLCHEMREVVEKVLPEFAARLEERNVLETDPETRARYLYEIPVLLLEGREIARHWIDEADLRQRLREAGLSPRTSSPT
jgi:hypothetical protein